MSLYANEIEIIVYYTPITIGSTPSVPTKTNYNYWSDTKTYVFNSNTDKRLIANNTVTINKDYILTLITDYKYTLSCYNTVLCCNKTFTNNGKVIIKYNAYLDIDYNNKTNIDASNNYGTIDIINGTLGLHNSATLNNTGTITLKDSSVIDIDSSSTLTNTGTIDISNITNLSYWYNEGTFKLEGGSTFILPKSIL
ncbi:MAG: hypothetical protein IJ481_03290, partial [Alphaproteobacteria bacterium]|nr:hypothetical protein [Alphaproteobacteria bacterium]